MQAEKFDMHTYLKDDTARHTVTAVMQSFT